MLKQTCLFYHQVNRGSRVSQKLPDFMDRVHTYSKKIVIQKVNLSDAGNYSLLDGKSRTVSVINMNLTGGSFLHVMSSVFVHILCLCVSVVRRYDSEQEEV